MNPRRIMHMHCSDIKAVFSFLSGLTYTGKIIQFQIVDGISVLGVPSDYDVFALVEEVQPLDTSDPFIN